MSNSIGIRKLSPLLVILLFFIYKLTHLGVSFFWDESWVYAPALLSMAEVGPSLLPDAIALDYSRGHPLLFHFLGGLWIKIFGTSFISMHSFALGISLVFLLYANALINRLKIPYLSFFVLLLLCVQPIFVAQASMVLPEMLLATLSLASIYYYTKQTYLPYIIAGVLTILTKETGILIIGTIVLYDVINGVFRKKPLALLIRNGLKLSIPLLTLIGHMLYLKYTFGWYLYPEHTGMIKSDLFSILSSFFHVIHDQIFYQMRILIVAPFILLYCYHLIQSKKFSAIIALLITIMIGAFTYKFYGDHFPVSLLFCVLAGHYVICQFLKGKGEVRILLLFLLFLFVYALFSAANFYTVRYLLSTLIFTLIIPIHFLMSKSAFRKWMPFYFIALTPIYIYQLLTPTTINDVNLTYLDYCPLQTQVVEYMEENQLYDEQINTMFLMSVALSDDKAGYRKSKEAFKYLNIENNKNVDYYIYYNAEEDYRKEGLKGEIIQRFEQEHIWFEIWKLVH